MSEGSVSELGHSPGHAGGTGVAGEGACVPGVRIFDTPHYREQNVIEMLSASQRTRTIRRSPVGVASAPLRSAARIVNKVGLILFFLMAAGIISCGSEDPISTGSGSIANAQNTPTATPQAIQRPDGGTTFLRVCGWPIPSFDGAEREEFETSIMTSDGRSVKAHLTVIRTDPLSLIIDNPLYFTGTGLEKVRVNKVKEYRTSAGVFSYRFLVNDADVDKNTNKVRSTRGFLYPYSYYDEDGDGVFESLVVSEQDRSGLKGFQNEPHLPEWSTLSR